MIRFGMPTLIDHASLAESVDLCRELGLRFVEINMNLPMYQPDLLDAACLRGFAGVDFTLHLDEALNPFDFNPLVAQAYRETALSAVRLARAAGMAVVNMHMPRGVYFTLPAGRVFLFDRYWGQVRGGIARFRDEMDRAAGGNVMICVENTAFGGFQHLPDALDLLLVSPAFTLTYDCGHDHADGGRAQDFYAVRADRVRHIHLHDAIGKTCHLPLGEGELDVSAVLSMAKSCRAVLETKDEPGLRASVKWLTERNLII